MQIATYPAPACGGHSAAIREALLPRRASLFGFCCNHHFLLCFLKFTITTSCNLEQVKEERNVRICGLQKLSMVDYPGKLAATVFTGGCNLRCPFCHNALLVTRLAESPALTEQDVLNFLSTRRGLLDGVVLSGGEPLLHPGAADFLAAVRDMGFAVKLDTNGFYPQALKEILDRGLADYVAMDIKNCPARYGETCGVPGLDAGPVEESLRLLIGSGVGLSASEITILVAGCLLVTGIATILQTIGFGPVGARLPVRRWLPRLGEHRARLLHRGGGHHYGHRPQPHYP